MAGLFNQVWPGAYPKTEHLANTLAYLASLSVKKKKSFMSLAPGLESAWPPPLAPAPVCWNQRKLHIWKKPVANTLQITLDFVMLVAKNPSLKWFYDAIYKKFVQQMIFILL